MILAVPGFGADHGAFAEEEADSMPASKGCHSPAARMGAVRPVGAPAGHSRSPFKVGTHSITHSSNRRCNVAAA